MHDINKAPDKILLIDGMNFIHRANITFGAKHARCDDQNFDSSCSHSNHLAHCSCGEAWDLVEQACVKSSNYTATYNFFRNLRATVEQFSPDKIFFVLEGHPKFRYELYPEYKSNRIIKTGEKQEAKNLLFANADLIVKLLSHLPISIAKADSYECDDVISSLCENMRHEDLTIISNDTDYIQLLQRGFKNIRIYSPTKKQYMEAPIQYYVALKALRGDKSDGIKSLVGPKKAEKLLADVDKLQQFLALEENRANFSINKQLIEFAEVPEDDIHIQDGCFNPDALKSEFSKLKFSTLIEEDYWNRFCKTFEKLEL
jgi:5'-3' exonuclease